MDDDNYFIIEDENGISRKAYVLNIISINNSSYVMYSVHDNEEEYRILAAKLIKDKDGNDDVVSIDDDNEKMIVYDFIRKMFNDLD